MDEFEESSSFTSEENKYEEPIGDILQGFFNKTLNLNVINKLYENLSINSKIINKFLNAHAIVQKYGMKNPDKEMVIIIDIDTGCELLRKTGGVPSYPFVEWEFPLGANGRYFTVHNHPSN